MHDGCRLIEVQPQVLIDVLMSMNLKEWLVKNRSDFGGEFEILFAETVLPLVPELSFDAISVQYPFKDRDNKQRYCDFVIHENNAVRIAIEIDGYDKRGTGTGMSHAEFIDWQRRQAALTSQGWYVLRFANLDVRDDPARCAEHISLLLKRSRSSTDKSGLSDSEQARLATLTRIQESTISHLKKETSVMKHTVTAFTTLILCLVLVIVWLSGGFSTLVKHSAIESSVPVQAAQIPLKSAPTPNESSNQASATCSTDSDCESKKKALQISKSQTGSTCTNPINWQQASQHIGSSVSIVGPIMKITSRKNIRGNPTWVDIGGAFPATNRMMLVIWEEKKNEFPLLVPGKLTHKEVCVTGQLTSYKGIPQIQLSEKSQLQVIP